MSEIPDKAPIFDEGIGHSFGKFCMHERTRIVEQQRLVLCSACAATLDPFDVLMQYARKDRVASYTKEEIARSRAELTRLQSEERLTKARVKNAKRKDAETAVADAKKAWTEKYQRAQYALGQALAMIEKAQRYLR